MSNEKIAQLEKMLETVGNELKSLKEEKAKQQEQSPFILNLKEGDKYWVATADGAVLELTFCDDKDDRNFIKNGAAWRTKEDAEKYGILGVLTPYVREVAAWNAKHNWKPDWSDFGQYKCCHYYNYKSEIIETYTYSNSQNIPNYLYFCEGFNPSDEAKAAFLKWLGVNQ